MFSLFCEQSGRAFAFISCTPEFPKRSVGAAPDGGGHRSALLPLTSRGGLADAPGAGHYTNGEVLPAAAYELLPAIWTRFCIWTTDILVINPIRALYQMDLTGYLFGAASHTALSPHDPAAQPGTLNAYERKDIITRGYC
jgi:hypothetical protein